MFIAALSVAAVLAAGAPSVSNGVTMTPGDMVVISLGPDGPVVADDSVVGKRGHHPSGDGVRLKFGPMPGTDGVILMVENGYARSIDYDARMFNAEGASASTSICVVKGNLTSVEHWPHPIAKLELSNFSFVADGEFRCE